MSSVAWLKQFLNRRDLEKSDGRPLFEYRVSRSEYDELHALLLEIYPRTSHDCAAFCLYAAEWWRRHGKGLTFDGLLESLELEVHYTQLYEEIERGLKFWGRSLRIVHHPSRPWRDFVGSLSREGGLPLQMLLNSQGSVRRFFRQLLRAQRMGVEMDADQAALAADELPNAWRDPDIFDLAARIVRHIWDLRAVVGKSSQPVVDLDRLRPDWQQRLPILVDNEVAAALVRGLVEDAQQIEVSGWFGLDVLNRLALHDGKWSFQRVVEAPPQIPAREIWRVLDISADAENKPRRIQLFLDDGNGLRPFAVATQWRGDGPFELTPLLAGSFVTSAVTELLIQAETNTQTYPARLLRGGEGLDASPWVFIRESDDDDEWRLVAQGSARVRASRVLVAAPPELQANSTAVEPCGTLDTPDGQRQLLRLVGNRASFLDPASGVRFEVEASASTDEANHYRLEGTPFGEELRSPRWCGVPKVVEQPVFGVRREVPARDLEWRPRHGDQTWQRLSESCIGQVELRLRRGETTLFLKSVHVVPPAASYEVRPSPEGALLILSDTEASHATLDSTPGFTAVVTPEFGEFAWTVTPTDDPPARISVDLRWTGGRRLQLRLPFPDVGVRYIDRAGRVLPRNATVSLANLPGCRVEAILPRAEVHPIVEGTLEGARDRQPSFITQSQFSHKLRRLAARGQTRRYVLDLSRLTEDVRLRLASSTELNACVRLEVEVGRVKTRLIVRRFPISMRIDDARTHAIVLRDKSETFVDNVLERMTVATVPIEAPNAEPMLLAHSDGGWPIDDADTGPRTRLVFSRDGDDCCARPVIWSPLEVSGPAPSLDEVATLDQAVTISWKAVRLRGILKVLDKLIDDPQHPEWAYLRPFLHSLGRLPATTYDVLDVLVQRPSLCVHALLSSTPEPGFQVVWSALEDLIFAWRLVPVRAWLQGFALWWAQTVHDIDQLPESIRGTALGAAKAHANNQLTWIEARLRGFTIVRELIAQRSFDAPRGQYLGFLTHPSGAGQQAMLHTRDEAYMNLYRTHADDRWPFYAPIRTLASAFPNLRPNSIAPIERIGHPVRESLLCVSYAPIQAAIAAACDIQLTAEQLFAIRQLETFDNTWFDTCYEMTLAAAIGVLLQADPEAFR
jgi:hypothetical protein